MQAVTDLEIADGDEFDNAHAIGSLTDAGKSEAMNPSILIRPVGYILDTSPYSTTEYSKGS